MVVPSSQRMFGYCQSYHQNLEVEANSKRRHIRLDCSGKNSTASHTPRRVVLRSANDVQALNIVAAVVTSLQVRGGLGQHMITLSQHQITSFEKVRLIHRCSHLEDVRSCLLPAPVDLCTRFPLRVVNGHGKDGHPSLLVFYGS